MSRRTAAAGAATLGLIVLGGAAANDPAIEGVPVTVEQGPRALAAAIYSPPAWLAPALALLGIGVLGVAALGYRRTGLDEQVKREAASNALVVGLIAAATVALTRVPGLPYAVDVGGGVVVGFAAAVWAQGALGLSDTDGTTVDGGESE